MSDEKRKKESAAVAPWQPFAELRDWPFSRGGFPARFDQLLRELGESWGGEPAGSWLPAMDVAETEQQYAVTLELAGVKREDVTVECHEGVLTIRGEKKSEREEKKEKRRFVERRYGTFSRSFSLPRDADADHVDAKFKDGVLTVTIPKLEAAKPRTVAIK